MNHHLQTKPDIRTKALFMDHPLVMGILNLTPDSFYDGDKYSGSEEAAVNHVKQMLEEGVDIIDIGAASTRPGATIIDPVEEQKRLLPFFNIIRQTFPDVLISIDTYHSSTAKICVENGANMINDISAGTVDEKIFEVVGHFQCPYVLMHIKGKPSSMQENPHYENIMEEMISYFEAKIEVLKKYGVKGIIIDPGFGFGKTLENNYEILKNLEMLKKKFDYPVLAGISRKSMVNKVIGTKPEDALNGTTALHVLALINGASILRVHDVKEANEVVKIFEKYKSG